MTKNGYMENLRASKIARICWNTERWTKPSGGKGKSANKKSYEYQNGLGHEEWLLDLSKIIDGYHYAFLQPINRNWKKYCNDKAIFNISLYSINDDTKQKWWIGEIQNVEVINEEKSVTICNEYKKRGWLQEMRKQVEDVGGKLNSNNSESLFNIRFREIDAKGILAEPRLLAKDDKSVPSFYYSTLLNKKEEPTLIKPEPIFIPGHNPQKNRYTTLYSNPAKEVNKLHSDIQTFCYKELVSEYGSKNVATEHTTRYGASVDIAVRTDNGMYYYEIKTSPILRECIRGALSQLLEYAHYSERKSDYQVTKLTIISHNEMTNEARRYINTLKETYGIPIYYRRADLMSEKLCFEE